MGFDPKRAFQEYLQPRGRVDIYVAMGRPKHILIGHIPNHHDLPLYRDHRIDFSGCNIISEDHDHNIILNLGKDSVIESLVPDSAKIKSLARMCVGDRGTSPSDPTVPKTPLSDRTTLYNEVFRSDAEAIVTNTRTIGGNLHEIRLVKTFASNGAGSVPITAFSNQGKPVLNEVGLVMINPAIMTSPRPDVSGPYSYPPLAPYPHLPISPYNYPPQDEDVFSMRTFKSVPFEAVNDITITIRYTIYIE